MTLGDKIISSIRHTAFVVRNLENSLKFYSGILGLDIYKRYTEEGPFIDTLTGIENVKLEWVKLVIPNGGLIELIQYHSYPDPDSFYEANPKPSNIMGCSHVALTVKDLEALYTNLIDNEYTCKSRPLLAPSGKAKILYCHDPDGAILELIEDL
jgi:catechol 2,3-dioxygenase-like lactoylglutathione lyase family enzyme|tara:strand:- start:449 stop:910 length:462 start_codon:yes stop_codon:yes gene_type:complete